MLGRLVAAMPPETRVVVVSDHGLRPWHHTDGPDAFFVAAGPGIADHGAKDPAGLRRHELPRLGHIHDVLPTLLSLVGLPFGIDMDGHPIEAALVRDPRLPQPAPIASWDDAAWLAARGAEAPAAGTPAAGEADEERLEQLRALGYIK
jgi:arylsulfatase A-like enzyme